MIEHITPEELLDSLRWRADQVITNYEGDRVWLKQVPGGITDCCREDDPCQRHRRLASLAH